MEFGTSTRVDAGANVVGLSWTSPQIDSDSNWLVTTTEARVSVHAAEDARLVNSWLTRPGTYNRFTVAAVQNRVTRRFYCVQNGNRLFSWSERESSLESATKKKLPGDVYALRTSHKLPVIIAVLTDGGICILNEKLEEIVNVPAAGDGSVVTWTRFARVPADDSRYVLLTLHQRPTVVGASSSKKAVGGQQPPPYMRVYTVVRAQGTPSEDLQLQFKHVATQQLPPPAAVLSSAGIDGGAAAAAAVRVTSITLHKLLNALSLLWSTGHLQVLQFSHSAHWYSSTPRQSTLRHLGRFLPSDSSEEHSSACLSYVQGASFALEPSCLVLAGVAEAPGAEATNSTGGDVGLSVWDVRYGVLLALKHVRPGGDDVDGSTPPAAADASLALDDDGSSSQGSSVRRTRLRSNSSASASAVGSMLSATQAVSSQALTPDTVFQVTVSEDNAYVAIASRRRVIVTAVAARGASLVSAIDRMRQTRLLLAEESLASDGLILPRIPLPFTSSRATGAVLTLGPSYVPPIPHLSLAACLAASNVSQSLGVRGAIVESSESAASTAAGRSAWAAAVACAADETQALCNAILDPTATPSTESVLAALSKAETLTYASVSDDLSSVTPRGASLPSAGKRKRVNQTGGREQQHVRTSAAAVLDTPPARDISRCLALCAVQRCIAALAQSAEPAKDQPSAVSLLQVAPVLRKLLQSRAVSVVASPSLLPALIAVATRPASAAVRFADKAHSEVRKTAKSRRSEGPTDKGAPTFGACGAALTCCDGVTALQLICEILAVCTDIPEAILIRIFLEVINSTPESTLNLFWAQSQSRSGSASAVTTVQAVAAPSAGHPQEALLHIVGLLVRAPRNDVFLEQALRSLSTEHVTVLLVCLNRLLEASVRSQPTSVVGKTAGTVSLAPSTGQVLDWVRMLLDAHFARLTLLVRAPGGAALQDVLTDVATAVTDHAALCDATASLRGEVLHLMVRGALPRPPQPDHVVEIITL